MQSINFEMVHKGLKPSRSARQLQDTLSQEFLISSDQSNQTNTLKFGSTGNQSNKFAFRPYGDSDECQTHHSEEVLTQFDECGMIPLHNLNIQPVAEVRLNSQSSENKYQYDMYDNIEDLNKFNNMQYQLTNSQLLEQLKRRSNSKPPLSRNNSTTNKDEITQFRGTDHCIAMNNSRKNSLATLGCGGAVQTGQQIDDDYVKQKVLINNKDLLTYNMIQQQYQQQQQQQNQLQSNTMQTCNQTLQGQTIESHRIIPNKPYSENISIEQQQLQSINKNNEISGFKLDNLTHNYSSQQKDSQYQDWVKEYQAANIPIPLQRVSSPQRHVQYQDNKYFAQSQQQQLVKQDDDCESLKPEDLLMSQQEYTRFQEVQKQINYQKQYTPQYTNSGSQDIVLNHLSSLQNSIPSQMINIKDQYQSIQHINNHNGTAPVIMNKDTTTSNNQPAHFNFNSTYSFSNNQFKQCIIPVCQQQQQYPHDYLQESGFNPEQQLNSISSSSILNIQSPKANTITQPLIQILQKESEKEEVQQHLQKLKEDVKKAKNYENKENKNNNSLPKLHNFLKRNQSLSNISSSPLNKTTRDATPLNKSNAVSYGKRSLHECVDKEYNVSANQTPNSKGQNRTTTPQPRLERKLSDNLLLDKSKKKIESYEEQQLKECTFKPQINKSSQKMQRSFSQFIETQSNYHKQKSDKQRVIQEQVQKAKDAEIKEKPEINRASQKIIEQKRNNSDQQSLFGLPQVQDQAVYNRLYSTNKRNESNNSQIRRKMEEEANKENTFKPQIHQRSKSIKRDEKVEDLLYKDAVRRNNIQQSLLSSKPRSNSKYVSEKSERILLKKFMKEMDYILSSLAVNQVKASQNNQSNVSSNNSQVLFNNLDMASLFETMIKSGFVKYNVNSSPDNIVMENEKKLIFLMWTLLGGKQFNYISRENLFFFLIIILNLDKCFDLSERSLLFKELSYSMSHSQSQNPSPLASQSSLKNFKNFETFTNIIQCNLNPQQQPQSAPISPLNKSNSSGFSSPSSASTVHQQLNISLMKSYQDNYIDISLGQFDEKQQWIVSDEDKNVIRQAFELFYRNRLSYEELKSQKNPIDQQCTFHPSILQNSKAMANQYREKLLVQTANLLENKEISYSVPKDGKIQHSDFLILQKRAQEIQNKNKQLIEKQKELIECSFKPSIIAKSKKENEKLNTTAVGIKKTDELFQQSKNKENRPIKNTIDAEYEKQKNECTFQPEILENRFKKNYEGGIFAKNVNKTIERMRNARKEKEIVNAMKSRGCNSVSQVIRHQKSVSSTSTAQVDQTCDNYNSTHTRKEDSLKNYNSSQQNYSCNTVGGGGERITSYNSCQATNDNITMQYSSNTSVLPKNLSPQNMLDNQFNIQNNNMQNQQTYMQQPTSVVTQRLLNNNIFANQAILQFQQKNVPNLQHSFSQQQSNGLLYNQNNNLNHDYNNQIIGNIQIDNNCIVDQQMENFNTLILNNASNLHNPILEQSAPKFGRLQENQIQNSWQQNNLCNNEEQYQDQVENNQPNSSEQGQESVSSVPDSKDHTPLLFVDVNLGNQRSERIIVNEGDNPKQLAYDFARLHGLDDSTAEKLYQLLENQIAGLLSRIEEEENISHLENLD